MRSNPTPAATSSRSLTQRIGNAAIVVSIGLLMSRLLGFGRELVLASVVGANTETDVYVAAFLIPDFVNYLLAGGYLSITFIPIFSRCLAQGREDDAWHSFVAVARPLALLAALAIAVAWVVAPMVFRASQPGFNDDQIAATVRLTRIVLPAQFFFIVGTLFMAVQYAHERFLVPTVAGIVYNLAIIAGGVGLGYGLSMGAEGFAWGVLVGAGVGSFGLQWIGARAAGMRWATTSWAHPAIKEYFWLALPLMLGQSIVFIDELLGRSLGSVAGAAAITWVHFGRRLLFMPVGVLGQAAGVAAYPFLAKLAAANRIDDVAKNVTLPLRYLLFVSCATAAGLVVAAKPIVRVLFERGAFTADDTAATAEVLQIFAVALPVWCVQQVVVRGFYARRQMWSPVVLGTLSTLVALPVYWILVHRLGHRGIAWASDISITAYTLALITLWFHRVGWRHAQPLVGCVVRSALSALVCGAVGHGLLRWGFSGTQGTLASAVAVTVVGVVMVAVWLMTASALNAPEVTWLKKRIRARGRRQ